MLRWIGNQLMMTLRGQVVMWSTNHPILGRSTPRWGYQILLLLAFLVNTDYVIRDNGIAHKFQESPVSVERKALLQLAG
jgi:hypothetical protein